MQYAWGRDSRPPGRGRRPGSSRSGGTSACRAWWTSTPTSCRPTCWPRSGPSSKAVTPASVAPGRSPTGGPRRNGLPCCGRSACTGSARCCTRTNRTWPRGSTRGRLALRPGLRTPCTAPRSFPSPGPPPMWRRRSARVPACSRRTCRWVPTEARGMSCLVGVLGAAGRGAGAGRRALVLLWALPGAFTGPGPISGVLARHPRLTMIVAHLGAPEYADFLDLAGRYRGVHLDTTMDVHGVPRTDRAGPGGTVATAGRHGRPDPAGHRLPQYPVPLPAPVAGAGPA